MCDSWIYLINVGIEQRGCRLLRRHRRPSISIYVFHILSARYSLLPSSLVNWYSTYDWKINTLQRLPKPACSHLLHPPLRLSTSERRVNKFYMVEERPATYTYTVSLPLSSSFFSLFFYKVAICANTLSRNKWISQSDFLNRYRHS